MVNKFRPGLSMVMVEPKGDTMGQETNLRRRAIPDPGGIKIPLQIA